MMLNVRPSKCLAVIIGLTLCFPAIESSARGSKSPNDPAVGALLAAFIREKHCGKKMPAGGMGELISDAYPFNADPLLIGAFAVDMKRRADAAYKSMPKASKAKATLCPHLEKVISRWMVDKIKNPGRYH